MLGDMELGWPMVAYFLRQALIGAGGGVLVGWVGTRLVNRVQLDAAGLYPVLTLGLSLLAYGLTARLGGSGFLAAYLAGAVDALVGWGRALAGPHAAIPHYRVDEDSNLPIAPGSIYLVDSGGQYADGTTDITRTVPVGEVRVTCAHA